ncbi:MAG: small neutral amino acid transporter SnatA (MarC family) [Maribacter sp.]|jgi:multiple antibiotic resistance protein
MAISLDAFQISGGVILFLFALTMIFRDGKPESDKHLITDYRHVTIFLVAIPSIASPSAIMVVVLMTYSHIYPIEQQDFTIFFGLGCNNNNKLITTSRQLRARQNRSLRNNSNM